MKNLLKNGLMLVAAGVLFTACEKSENQPSSTASVSSGDKMIDLNQAASYLSAQGYLTTTENGNGATFIVPGQNGSGFLLFKDLVFDSTGIVSGQAGFFGADYGPNDFWRENPDGTLSVKLSSNTADLGYDDFGTGESYAGTGNMHMIYTGEVIVITVPFPPFEITLIQPGARGSVDMKGVGKVTLDGLPGTKYQLKGQIHTSASGQVNNKLEFN